MKTKRYTDKALERDLIGFNSTLENIGHDMRLIIGGHNGYTAVDLATVEQAKRHCIQRNLECGTPRECLNACNAYMASAALNMLAARN